MLGAWGPKPSLAMRDVKAVTMLDEAFHLFTPCLQPEQLQKPFWIKELGTKCPQGPLPKRMVPQLGCPAGRQCQIRGSENSFSVSSAVFCFLGHPLSSLPSSKSLFLIQSPTFLSRYWILFKLCCHSECVTLIGFLYFCTLQIRYMQVSRID